MIRVEVRKIPRRIVSLEELGIEDPETFEYAVVKLYDFSLNR